MDNNYNIIESRTTITQVAPPAPEGCMVRLATIIGAIMFILFMLAQGGALR